MLPRQADVRFAIVVIVVALLALVFSGQLIVDPPITLTGDLLAMNPRVFPFLILFGTVLVTFIFLVGQAREGAFKTTDIRFFAGGFTPAVVRQAAFLVITVSCALLLNSLGFITTMFILMAATSVLVGNRSPVQVLSISLLIPIGFYIVVTHVLRTALPEVDIVERLLQPLLQLLPAF